MVKAVLEAIPIYWMHFWIPMGVIEKIKKLCFRFLWSRHKDSFGLPWTSWKTLACPKFLGGWGIENIFMFFKCSCYEEYLEFDQWLKFMGSSGP